jgi:hypothetical protein
MANTGIEMSRQMLSTSQVLTLDWQIASLFQTLERQVHPEPCRGAGHQRERRHAELPRLRQRREPVHVRDHGRDAAPPDAGEVLAERRGAALVQREHERRNGVGRGELRRDVVPDGHDVVVGRELHAVQRAGLGVQDGDREAAGLQDPGQAEHGVDVALVREREEERAGADAGVVARRHGGRARN